MATWTQDRLARELENNHVESLYCLYGEEPYLMDEALKGVISRALGEGLKDFNYDVFYPSTASPSQILDTAGTLPMMASKRVVVIKEAHQLKEKHLDAMMSLVEDPIESTTLVLVASKIDQRRKFFKLFSKVGAMVKFTRPNEAQLPHWIQQMAENHGKKLTRDANQLLVQLVGPNLMEINNELQKVAQYVGDKDLVDWKDVEKVVSRVRVESVFDLANAVGRGDRAEALTSLVNLLDHGENEVGVLALVSRHIRILMLTKEALGEGLSQSQIAQRVGVPPYFLKQYMDQSQKWSRPQLEKLHRLLIETDRALKSSPVSSHIWLENFVIKSCDILR